MLLSSAFLALAKSIVPLLVSAQIIAFPEIPPPPVAVGMSAVMAFQVLTSFRLDVPYTVQAPLANWNIHEESCEEAALLMARQYVNHEVEPSAAVYDQVLREMKAQQVRSMGREKDLTMQEMLDVWHGLMNQTAPAVLMADATPETIRWELAQRHVVILPVMSHGLGNPHYGPKSVYHMLLLIGYDGDRFIANDAGIKQGRGWVYGSDVVMRAFSQGIAHLPQPAAALVIGRD